MLDISQIASSLRLVRTARAMTLAFFASVISCLISGEARADCENTAEGRVCRVQQPIAAGAEVDTATQRQLGLVTVNGGCSGTLISQYLVLTARHCVKVDKKPGAGPLMAPGNVNITAKWAPGVTAVAARVEDFQNNPGPSDIILVRLGLKNFGPVDSQPIRAYGLKEGNGTKLSGRVRSTDLVTQYGQGLSTFASGTYGTASAQPATGSGTYRSAQFNPSSITTTGYELVMNSSSQIGHGGDSGGPTVVTVNGYSAGIVGVQSTCNGEEYIDNTPASARAWQWATRIGQCQYAATEPFMGQISDARREAPPFDCVVAGVHREDIAASDCEEAQTTGCIRRLLSNAQYTACLSAQARPALDTKPCAAYASNAVQQARLNVERNCGGSGGRWTTSNSDHYHWCLSQNGNMSAPNAEAAARDKVIAGCKPKPPVNTGTVEVNVNRPYGDYRDFAMEPSIAGFAPCQSQCLNDASCKAWTFVVAGIQGPKAHCWLKNTVPKPVNDKCCVSGVK